MVSLPVSSLTLTFTVLNMRTIRTYGLIFMMPTSHAQFAVSMAVHVNWWYLPRCPALMTGQWSILAWWLRSTTHRSLRPIFALILIWRKSMVAMKIIMVVFCMWLRQCVGHWNVLRMRMAMKSRALFVHVRYK